MYIIELEKGVWLSEENQSTKHIDKAKKFKQKNWAKLSLRDLRKLKAYDKAKIRLSQ